MADPGDARGRPFQYRASGSWLHRTGAGWKLLGATAVSVAALAAHDPLALAALCVGVASVYASAQLPLADLWRDLRWLLLQGAIVVLLTLALRGRQAFGFGCATALQIVLVFLPVGLVVRTTPTEALLAPLRRRLPERLGFAIGAMLRLLPVFLREVGELYEVQRLRGARLRARDLWRPTAWRDWLGCIALPMTVRAIEVAQRAAEAADMRGIGSVAGTLPASESWAEWSAEERA